LFVAGKQDLAIGREGQFVGIAKPKSRSAQPGYRPVRQRIPQEIEFRLIRTRIGIFLPCRIDQVAILSRVGGIIRILVEEA
jgi:hypothetical protein